MKVSDRLLFLLVILYLFALIIQFSSLAGFAPVEEVTVRATDTGRVALCINNQPTVNTSSCKSSTDVYDIYRCYVTASDPRNNNSITFTDNTTLFDIDSSTGEILFVPDSNEVGTYNITIGADDNLGCSNSVGYSNLIITVGSVCGDGICSSDEDYNSCSADCFNPDQSSSSGGGGGGGSAPIIASLKITADSLQMNGTDEENSKVYVENIGDIDLRGMNISVTNDVDNLYVDIVNSESGITGSAVSSYFTTLRSGEKLTTTLRIRTDGLGAGEYRIGFHADSRYPAYSQSTTVFIIVIEDDSALKVVDEAENYIRTNPECNELLDVIDQAREKLTVGDYEKAIELARSAVMDCNMLLGRGATDSLRSLIPGESRAAFKISPLEMLIILAGSSVMVYLAVMGVLRKHNDDEEIIEEEEYNV